MGVGFNTGQAAIGLTTLDSWLATPTGPPYQMDAPLVHNCRAVIRLYLMTRLERAETFLHGTHVDEAARFAVIWSYIILEYRLGKSP